jgi:diguanylate cyclase (GGDEF)-like protein
LSIGGAMAEIRQNRQDYIYVATSVSLAFGLYGHLLGRHADRLAELSETDPLTGLSNARRLFSRLDAELARVRRYREPLALLLVDLDGLKSINDRHGHHAGDEAIRGLGDVIRAQLRETDTGARWGGDEFAVLAPNTGEPAALALAERIRALIPTISARWSLTGSLGVATIDPGAAGDVDDAATLMRAADAALYEAKQRGRNRVVKASTHPPGLPPPEERSNS